MNSERHRLSTRRLLPRTDTIALVSLIAFTAWVAHFLLFQDFGFYEDDYWHVTPFLDGELTSLQPRLQRCLTFPQGRPLGFFFTGFLSFIAARLGGAHVAWVLAFAIITTSSILYYLILKKSSSSGLLALSGALIFCLYPPVTSHPFLQHAFMEWISMLFLLSGTLLYLSGRKKTSYVLILGSLLTYESLFLVFLGVPLLTRKWDRSLFPELLRHLAVLAAMMLCVLFARISFDEQRMGVLQAHGIWILKRIPASVLLGPTASLLLLLYQPATVVPHWSIEITIILIVSFAVFLWAFRSRWFTRPDTSTSLLSLEPTPASESTGGKEEHEYPPGIVRLLIAGAVMLALSCVTSFTHSPPLATHGRITSVHIAGAVGGSLIFACVWVVIVRIAEAHGLRLLSFIALCFYLALVVTFRYTIQMDFKQAWENQRWFWSSVVESCPDMTDGTIILADTEGLPDTYYILSRSWPEPLILPQVLHFPEEWNNPPRVLPYSVEQLAHLDTDGESWQAPWPPGERSKRSFPMEDGNIILLRKEGNELRRSDEPLSIRGRTITLKQSEPPDVSTWAKGTLYDHMLNDPITLAPASSSYGLLPFDPEREVGGFLSEAWRLVRGASAPND